MRDCISTIGHGLPAGRAVQLGVLGALLALGVGCKQRSKAPTEPAATSQAAPPSDQQMLGEVQAKINAEAALNGQDIRVSVANGIATLSGVAANNASRALAAADSGSVAGIRTVINNLTVAPPVTASKAEPKPAPRPEPKKTRARPPYHREAAPEPQNAVNEAPPPPPPAPRPEAVQTVAPPPPPRPPAVKTVTVPAGSVIPVRMTDSLDSATTESDSVFHGSLAADLIVDGMIAAPRGSAILGRVVTAKDAGHFTGSSQLTLELTKIYAGNQEISVVTNQYTKEGAARGKNTAVKSGVGAVVGGLIGAIAGGGKGAAIGAAAGGGVGAGANGVTRGQQVQIPSETIVNFKLQSPFSVRTSRAATGSPNYSPQAGPQLRHNQTPNQ